MLREYALLRTAIWEVLIRHLPEEQRTRDFGDLVRVVDRTLDYLIAATVSAYGKLAG